MNFLFLYCKVTSILGKYGWPGSDGVSTLANMTLFLVVQQADQATQEKYFPIMREAEKNDKAQGSSLALLEDRLALGQGKRKVYDSQVARNPETGKYYALPLDDPDNVYIRRASVGLQLLGEYVSR